MHSNDRTQEFDRNKLQQLSRTRVEITENFSQKNMNIILPQNKYQAESMSSADFRDEMNNNNNVY